MERTLRDFVKNLIGGAKQAKPANPENRPSAAQASPPINQPYRVHQYVCKNCGMYIKQQHRHTRKECQAYLDNSATSDFTDPSAIQRKILAGINDPKVMLPFYFEEVEG